MKYLVILLSLLLGQVALAQPQDTSAMQPVALSSIAAASVSSSYATLVANATPVAYRSIEVINLADCTVLVSYNASTDHDIVPAQTSLTINAAEFRRHISQVVSIKYTGGACTTGTVYGVARY